MRQSNKNLFLNRTLQNIANQTTSEKAPSSQVTKSRKRKLTDEQVLEARALCEFLGWTKKPISDRYGISLEMAKSLCNGNTARHLIPNRSHLPADVGP